MARGEGTGSRLGDKRGVGSGGLGLGARSAMAGPQQGRVLVLS